MKPRSKVKGESGQIEIRLARPKDALELLGLIQSYYRFDGIRFRAQPIAQAVAQLLKDRRLGCAWIMRDGLDAVGYVVLTFNFDLEFGGFEGMVTDLYVCEAYRGRGLGKRALEIVDDYCRSIKIGTVELQVEAGNQAAQAFYYRIGFARLNRIVMRRAVKPRRGRSADAVLVEGNHRRSRKS
jgi:ribosomal protein S18 acetylase RimI-like enzyme